MKTKAFGMTHGIALLFVLALLIGMAPAAALAQQATPGAIFLGDGWQASYWNNITLSGSPALSRVDGDINFNWGLGSPAPEINADNFSARWTRTLLVTQPGAYRFTLNSDDGSRLFINDQLVINAWYDHGPARTFSATRQLNAGAHEVRIEYYERRGAAVIRFGWSQVGAPSACAGAASSGSGCADHATGGRRAVARRILQQPRPARRPRFGAGRPEDRLQLGLRLPGARRHRRGQFLRALDEYDQLCAGRVPLPRHGG
ncbi:MAG: hypothetical protein KatS3mg048_2051 [Caldilinea sp.]|nr:MAG: hypothetical protein KatS3mg048_2051 [Caldilinea sp.]